MPEKSKRKRRADMSLFLHVITENGHRIIPASNVEIVHHLKDGTVTVCTPDGNLPCKPSISYGSFAECAEVANAYASGSDHDGFIFAAASGTKQGKDKR
jgi:hypothetical protein